MPRILPPGGDVDWPLGEGALGVVGVAPWATLDFCSLFYSQIKAAKDWHYPRLIVDLNSKIPSRGRHLQLGEADPSPMISATIRELADQGATVAVVPCNTAHIFYERWARDAPIPVPNIIVEAVKGVASSGGRNVVPLISESLSVHGTYEHALEEQGLICMRLGRSDQDFVTRMIAEVKLHGAIRPDTRRDLIGFIQRLRGEGADHSIIGCTELSSLEPIIREHGITPIDSNRALVQAALPYLGLPSAILGA